VLITRSLDRPTDVHAADSTAAKLGTLKRDVRREWQLRIESVRRFLARVWRRETLTALFVALLKALAVVALPFLVYVRASVLLYRHGAHAWVAILVAAILTLGIVSGFVMLIARRFRGRARVPTVSNGRLCRWCSRGASMPRSIFHESTSSPTTCGPITAP
jgi:hypothetical protein